MLLLCVNAFVCGTCIKKKIFIRTNRNYLIAITYAILFLLIISNDYMRVGYKNILSAQPYDTILMERENLFKNASDKKLKMLTVKSYDLALNEYIMKNHAYSSITYIKVLRQKPVLIFNDTNNYKDSDNIKILQRFYNIDSVIIDK